jgi:hypothetical protein|tara:strand:- start:12 stop:191 length:180 start_codon:yes stop_codon:yes gene_type:complete
MVDALVGLFIDFLRTMELSTISILVSPPNILLYLSPGNGAIDFPIKEFASISVIIPLTE